jgi:hypothetical protein
VGDGLWVPVSLTDQVTEQELAPAAAEDVLVTDDAELAHLGMREQPRHLQGSAH